MPTLSVFNSISMDGYFTGANGDLSWAYSSPQDDEWRSFVSGNASGGGPLLFGRVTDDMMASFWPTPSAAQQMPKVAEGMNRAPKFVCSRRSCRSERSERQTEVRRVACQREDASTAGRIELRWNQPGGLPFRCCVRQRRRTKGR